MRRPHALLQLALRLQQAAVESRQWQKPARAHLALELAVPAVQAARLSVVRPKHDWKRSGVLLGDVRGQDLACECGLALALACTPTRPSLQYEQRRRRVLTRAWTWRCSWVWTRVSLVRPCAAQLLCRMGVDDACECSSLHEVRPQRRLVLQAQMSSEQRSSLSA